MSKALEMVNKFETLFQNYLKEELKTIDKEEIEYVYSQTLQIFRATWLYDVLKITKGNEAKAIHLLFRVNKRYCENYKTKK